MYLARHIYFLFWYANGVHSALTITTGETANGMPAPLRLKRILESELDGKLRNQEDANRPILLPCCYDGLSARLVAKAGFEATFMTGFGYGFVPLILAFQS